MAITRSPEFDLLCEIIRPQITSGGLEKINQIIRTGVDWQKLIRIGEDHHILALFARAFTLVSEEWFPHQFVEFSKNYSEKNLFQNILATKRLLEVLNGFEDLGIGVIPYKGPVLSATLYGNLAYRQFGDLDIIVPKGELERSKAILSNYDFERIWPRIGLTDAQERSHIENKYNYTFYRPNDRVILELHWGVSPKYFSFPPKINWFWEKAAPVSIFGRQLFGFSPEDYLLILCVHGGNHCWIRLNWVCDIAQLMFMYPNIRWPYVIQEASRFGIKRLLLTGILLAHNILGTVLPDIIWEAIKADWKVSSLAKEVELRYQQSIFIGSRPFMIPIFHIKSREKLFDKLRYLLFMNSPSIEDWNFVELPDYLFFLYYLIRPVRLINEYGVVPLFEMLNLRN